MTDIVALEEKEIQEINEGRKAGNLLEDPVFRKAYDEIREQALKDFENSEPDQGSVRDLAYYRLKGMKEIERVLKKRKARGTTAKQKQAKRVPKEK